MTGSERDAPLYHLMLELDRLEELREDLDELGIRTIEDLEQRIDELSRRIDEASDGNEE